MDAIVLPGLLGLALPVGFYDGGQAVFELDVLFFLLKLRIAFFALAWLKRDDGLYL